MDFARITTECMFYLLQVLPDQEIHISWRCEKRKCNNVHMTGSLSFLQSTTCSIEDILSHPFLTLEDPYFHFMQSRCKLN